MHPVPVTDAAITTAVQLAASVQDLDGIDALHAVLAESAGAELVTVERPTKPLYRVPGLRVTHVAAAAQQPRA